MKIIAVLGLWTCLVTAPADGALAAQAPPVRTVERLYRAFAWEAILSGTAARIPGFAEQPERVLKDYLTDDLTRLLLADRRCAARSHEICNLDFLPLWASQDPLVSELTITPTADSTVIGVQYRTGDGTHTIQMTYHLTLTPRGWRISDIVYSGKDSLKGQLTPR